MKRSSLKLSLFISIILILTNAGLGYAAPKVSAFLTGNGRVIVQGDGFAGVAGVEIDLQYDHAALTNPRVDQGGLIAGMLMTADKDKAGCNGLCYSGTYTFPKVTTGSSGTIAEITFDTAGSSPPNMTGIAKLNINHGPVQQTQTFTVVDAGNNVSNNGQVNDGTGSEHTGNTGSTGNTRNTGSGAGNSGSESVTAVSGSGGTPAAATGSPNATWLGGVSIPGAETVTVAKVVEEADSPTADAEKMQKQTTDTAEKKIAPPTDEASPPTPSQEINGNLKQSVLERFRVFQGDRTSQNLVALFKGAMAGIIQEPPVAISDGKSIVKISVILPATGNIAPNFALQEAKLVSLNKSNDSAWVVEALPNKGTFDAAVIVLQNGKAEKVPLTIAPPLPASARIGKDGVLTEADFNTFLKERGAEKAPRFDLNGDGKRDYIDDYIFTANFLAKADARRAATDKKSQVAR